tara:strand:- start:136 stop:342 length:207 start_codon:yes stop_codon:yes gene_type:complete
MEISKYLNYVCGVAETIVKNNSKNNIQIIDGIGELQINGVFYQAQILLESNENKWVKEDRPTIRSVED